MKEPHITTDEKIAALEDAVQCLRNDACDENASEVDRLQSRRTAEALSASIEAIRHRTAENMRQDWFFTKPNRENVITVVGAAVTILGCVIIAGLLGWL